MNFLAFLKNIFETKIKQHRRSIVFFSLQIKDGVYIYVS